MDNPNFQRSEFSATASLSGYLFQCRYALLEVLKRIKQDIKFSVSIEYFDDVVFESGDDIVELLQTKHHQSRIINLTDASPDLWKSIRIWCDYYKKGGISSSTAFYLITTSQTIPKSIAKLL
jgi:hypothetical protein